MPQEPKYPGLGERLRQRIHQLGYSRADNSIDTLRFCREYAYTPTNVYAWYQDRSPDKYLDRLAKDLGVTKGWLCFGEGEPPQPPKLKRRGQP